MLEVIKRNGERVPFNRDKITNAIEKAMNSSSGIYEEGQAAKIAGEIEAYAASIQKDLTIYAIEDQVYYRLLKYNNPATARAYENYKTIQAFKRQTNTTDDDVFGLLNNTNLEVLDENSNKNGHVVSTQRDLIAGEVSKDIARRKLIPADIVQAHDSGAIHFHDMDYIIQPMFNCCLINLEDMLANGTVINGKKIDTPKSFQVACTVTTQIIAQVASGQYGGQSINGIDRILAPYVRKSFKKYMKAVVEEQREVYGIEPDMEKAEEIAWKRTKKEIKDGIQTIQYQINTLMTTNGQAPFVTLFIIWSGIGIAKDTISPLLGEAPDEGLVHALAAHICRYDKILGIHDLIVHDYGPGRRFASVHVEIDHREDVLDAHELIDDIEREVKQTMNVDLVIHYDPVVTDDAELNEIKGKVTDALKSFDERLGIHDFRMVRGTGHTNVIFDVVIPHEYEKRTDELKKLINQTLENDKIKYFAVVTFDSESFNDRHVT